MILTVAKISLLRLLNSKQELLLIFVVPVMFFSIFAMIFSRGVGSKVKQVPVSIINDDPTPGTARVIRALLETEEIKRVTGIGATSDAWPIDRLARAVMSSRPVDVVVYFPADFHKARWSQKSQAVQILNEGTNPISSRIVEAALTQALMGDISQRGLPSNIPRLTQGGNGVSLASASSADASQVTTAAMDTSLPFEHRSIFASNKHEPKIAMYAAGIAVMFLLFSSIGAGASLLEEKEAGTLGRLLGSRLTVGQLLAGKWIYITLLGFVQLSAMFIWGWFAFGVDLFHHGAGFVVMSAATSSASASFALFLAVISKSRNQLNGIALVIVLSMSALGGSMIPRYLMSESMQRLGRLTFNGWALDGYKKVFWYDLPVVAIQSEVLVLAGITVFFGVAARMLVNQWSLNS